jgi:predicted sulfurtransferase
MEQVKTVVREAGLSHVYYLKGGLKRYKQYLQEQLTMRKPADIKDKTCPACP